MVPDRPVFLRNRAHRGGWANARALEAAGIDRSTPDPVDGRGQEYLHGFGVTAWQDAILGDCAGTPDVAPAYLRGAERDALTARVRGAPWWDRGRERSRSPSLSSVAPGSPVAGSTPARSR